MSTSQASSGLVWAAKLAPRGRMMNQPRNSLLNQLLNNSSES